MFGMGTRISGVGLLALLLTICRTAVSLTSKKSNLVCPSAVALPPPNGVKAYGRDGGNATVMFSIPVFAFAGYHYFRVVPMHHPSSAVDTACSTAELHNLDTKLIHYFNVYTVSEGNLLSAPSTASNGIKVDGSPPAPENYRMEIHDFFVFIKWDAPILLSQTVSNTIVVVQPGNHSLSVNATTFYLDVTDYITESGTNFTIANTNKEGFSPSKMLTLRTFIVDFIIKSGSSINMEAQANRTCRSFTILPGAELSCISSCNITVQTDAKIKGKLIGSHIYLKASDVVIEKSAVVSAGNIHLIAVNVELEDEAAIHADGMSDDTTGETCFVNSAYFGAPHGGQGGKLSHGDCPSSQVTYGNANAPTTPGSKSGDTRGGGVVRLEVSGTLKLGHNSRISADGASGARGSGGKVHARGGGSGGSVWITAETLSAENSSLVSAKGGDGGYYSKYKINGRYEISTSGGGGGGRMLFEVGTMRTDNVAGTLGMGLSVSGGEDGGRHVTEKIFTYLTTGTRGLGGSIVVNIEGLSKLHWGSTSGAISHLALPMSAQEMNILASSSLSFEKTASLEMSETIQVVLGALSTLALSSAKPLFMSSMRTSPGSTLSCAHDGCQLFVSGKVNMAGAFSCSDSACLLFAEQITEFGGGMACRSHLCNVTTSGAVSISSRSALTHSSRRLLEQQSSSPDSALFLKASDVVIEKSAVVSAGNIHLIAVNVELEDEAAIHADGMSDDTTGETCFVNSAYFGAPHGGQGGKLSHGDCPSSQVTYGNANAPTTPGSKSGDTRGGGVVRLEVSGTLKLGHNSRISADGASGARGSGGKVHARGGGSGGSVWITAETLSAENSSLVSAKGGDGGYYSKYKINGRYEISTSGGGGGGRMLFEVGTMRTDNVAGTLGMGLSVSGGEDGGRHVTEKYFTYLTTGSRGLGGSIVPPPHILLNFLVYIVKVARLGGMHFHPLQCRC